RGSHEPVGSVRRPAVHQERKPGAVRRVAQARQLPLPLVPIVDLGQPRETVLVPATLALEMSRPVRCYLLSPGAFGPSAPVFDDSADIVTCLSQHCAECVTPERQG